MSAKRSNNAIWKITISEGVTPKQRLEQVLNSYKALSSSEPSRYQPIKNVELQQPFENVTLKLCLRRRSSQGFLPFVRNYLHLEEDETLFTFTAKDVCLFVATESSLFVITSGSGYRIIENHVDQRFPFDAAKRLIANNFKAADIREFTGATTSKTETYRYGYSIAKSEAFGKVWKRLVGRLNSNLLTDGSYIKEIIDPRKPPVIEVKSCFVLRKSLDLGQVVSLVKEIEGLPEPTEEQKRELSFLDSLYPVKDKELEEELQRQIIEDLRQAIVADLDVDLDICDPEDISRYYAGSGFRVFRWMLSGDPPEKDDVIDVLKQKCTPAVLSDKDAFFDKLMSFRISYSSSDDDQSSNITVELHKFLHGQVDFRGETFFLLDKVWYRSQGEFLDNLKRHFIEETFINNDPILNRADLGFLAWGNDDENTFNKRQAEQVGNFYFGDKIFAVSDRGKIELFDLLKFDKSNNTLYVIHAKEGFNAKMRDACSQISVSAEVIQSDLQNGKPILKEYYKQWTENVLNATKKISEEEFLSWFDMKIVYIVLASTTVDFVVKSFESNILNSHIARREVIATRNEFKGHGRVFRLAHTKRISS